MGVLSLLQMIILNSPKNEIEDVFMQKIVS